MNKNENNIKKMLEEKIINWYDIDDDEDDIDEAIGDLNNIVVLHDENGDRIEFEFLDLIIYKGEEYVILLPVDEDEVVILKVDESDNSDEESYISVDDDEIFQAVFKIFKNEWKDEFDFTD